jgi:ribosomal peptide maturation radical SAM protein 1
MKSNVDVILVNMPFGNLLNPSIGLGLLKAGLTRLDISVTVFNFQLRFAELIGEDNYTLVYGRTHTEQLSGEFIFASALFDPPWATDIENFIHESFECCDPSSKARYSADRISKLKDAMIVARQEVDSFLQECMDQVLALEPRVVGFTSLFHQHAASLAFARRIKEQRPETFIILGGSNCEGMMGAETLRQFNFVDAVMSGEGDLAFPNIVKNVLESQPQQFIEGVFTRKRFAFQVLQDHPRNTAIIENLDALPVPDYDEYFDELKRSSLTFTKKASLLFETSRGCWWGEKQHCTFCGLNGETMKYRSKSAARALNEFLYLTERYPGCSVNAVDNILDMDYFKDFIPMLAERKHEFNLFYEVKANLKKEQLKLLRSAGIGEIQPGIESFSDNVLHIMRKGVSALQNIQLLKWCSELGIKVYYNLIWGFPGESPDDYREMLQLIPLITHLPPPVGEGAIRIDRFSPNFERADELGFTNLSPHPAYGRVYPFERDVLANLAYFFVADDSSVNYTDHFAEEVRRWRTSHRKSKLFWATQGDRLLIWDFRPTATEVLTVLKGHEKFSYLACEQVRTPRQIVELSRDRSEGRPLELAEVSDALESLLERRLMVRRGSSYLALACAQPREGQSLDAKYAD